MKKLLILPIVLPVFALFAMSAPSAVACSPAPGWPPTIKENLATREVAFVGTVKSIMQDKSINGDYHVTFAVDTSYKGNPGEVIILKIRSSSAACGYDDGYKKFAQGSVWAIFANGNDKDGYTTDHLSLNVPYPSLASANEALLKEGLEPVRFACTMEYAPVCGRLPDGSIKTYGNACAMKTAKAEQLYAGECRVAGNVPAKDMRQGSRGETVTWLQSYLTEKNMGPAAKALASVGPTGYFGVLTRAALAEFQKAHAILPAQGYFGAKTRAFISTKITPEPKDEAITFTGTLQAVDIACFADGVCSATVDGKKVVLLSGFRIPPIPAVGKIVGVDSIGDLEAKIGSKVEVRAAMTSDSDASYTLYGSEDYYLKVLK